MSSVKGENSLYQHFMSLSKDRKPSKHQRLIYVVFASKVVMHCSGKVRVATETEMEMEISDSLALQQSAGTRRWRLFTANHQSSIS